jgi:uncharacterized protein YuzE
MDMDEPTIRYDEPRDTLHVSFAPGQSGTGLELNENLLLRVDTARRIAIGLTLFNFSLLAQRTEMGPRSFPLSGIAELTPEMRELALGLLLHGPVSQFLTISAYSPAETLTDVIPITSLRSDRIMSHAT